MIRNVSGCYYVTMCSVGNKLTCAVEQPTQSLGVDQVTARGSQLGAPVGAAGTASSGGAGALPSHSPGSCRRERALCGVDAGILQTVCYAPCVALLKKAIEGVFTYSYFPVPFRLLYSLAFNARFLRHLWSLISSMTTRMITGYVSHGFLDWTERGKWHLMKGL